MEYIFSVMEDLELSWRFFHLSLSPLVPKLENVCRKNNFLESRNKRIRKLKNGEDV